MNKQKQIGQSFVNYAWNEMDAPDAQLVALKVLDLQRDEYAGVLELPTGNRRALVSRWGEIDEVSMDRYDVEFRHVDNGFWRMTDEWQSSMGTYGEYTAQNFCLSSDNAAQDIGEAMETALNIALRNYYANEQQFFEKSVLEREFSVLVVPKMLEHEDAGATEDNARLMIAETYYTMWGVDNPLADEDIGPWVHHLANDGFKKVVDWLELYEEDEKGT